ncbi:DUF2271 domain-containing protein [Chryseobacterium sp. CFS15]|uniref:DUF2271 domain-containing protein n=1 Tax=Chryseobacterium sp. CFS15 TaxID=2986946 RepID=UPI0028068418|nr:DUF2271 domain-containing protein [Chryseobacterium sp. CFS15]MDQ8140727.1 DUF2271 domain-containing protein [Chryseobacterium sp. CFS15]
MKYFKIQALGILMALFCSSFANAQASKYKCMLQLTSYGGEGAYVVVSLINPKGGYEKTLYMMGPDAKWHDTLKEWHKFQSKKPVKLNAITGASVADGDRSITTFSIEDKYLNKGYKVRFETAVEDKKYNVADLEIPFTTDAIIKKTEGKGGYIRYVKLNKL